MTLETTLAFELTKRETPTTAAVDECRFQVKLQFLSEYFPIFFKLDIVKYLQTRVANENIPKLLSTVENTHPVCRLPAHTCRSFFLR